MSKSRDIADSAATINFIDTVTSNVQTQLNTLTTAVDNISVTNGSLTKTFTAGESSEITLSSSVLVPNVSVTKEIPQTGATNNNWDAAAGSYTLEDSAPATTLSWSGFGVSGATFVDSFSTSAQETSPIAVAFSTDGTKMFVAGGAGQDVNEYTLSTGFDVSTSTFVDSFSVSLQVAAPYGLTFNNDGTKMYVVDFVSGKDVNQYTLSTGFDVSTSTYLQSFSVSGQIANPVGIAFNTDGTRMFVVGSTAVKQYNLSTGFDVSSASYSQSFSVSAQESDPTGIAFNSDGTKMFVNGTASDSVNSYSLSTGFDISTASFSESFNYSAQEASSYGLAFSPDGTKMFVVGTNGQDINEYTIPLSLTLGTGSFASTDVGKTINVNDGVLVLTAADGSYVETTAPTTTNTAASGEWSMFAVVYDAADDVLEVSNYLALYDVANASYSSVNFNLNPSQGTSPTSIRFNNDGSKMFVVSYSGQDVNEYTLSTNFNVSTASFVDAFSVASQEAQPYGLAFSSDGTKMYVCGVVGDAINEYTLSTGFDISTSSYTRNFSVSSKETDPTGIAFNNDGTKMYVTGMSSDAVNQYALSTAFNVSTASFVQAFSVGSQATHPMDVVFNSDGTVMIVAGYMTQSIYKYALTTGFDVSTASYTSSSINVSSVVDRPQGLAFNNDGTKMFITDNTTHKVYEYTSGSVSAATGYQPCISSNIDSTYWTDINSLTATNAIGDGNVFYAVSNDARDSWSVLDNTDGVRDIVKNNAGTWQYNSNGTYTSETWANAATNTEAAALREAMEGATSLVNAFELSSVVYSQLFSVAAQDTQPYEIEFNTDGTKMFIVGNNGNDVNEYTLSTAFDVSTATFVDSFSVAAQDSIPCGLAFNTDGTKMFVVGNVGQDVNEYTLSTGFDVSTASFVDSFSVASQDTSPIAVSFNTGGTKMFVLGNNGQDVNEYTLSTGFDVSTSTFVDSFSVASQETNPIGMTFNPSGTKMFIAGQTAGIIFQYALSTAFDVSTASYSSSSFSVSSQDAAPTGLVFNTDGSKLYVVGAITDTVYEYSVGTTAYTNQMDSTALNAITDANQITLGDDLDFAAILYYASGSTVPTYSGTAINYDANILNQGAVLGTDYNFDAPAGNKVRITAVGAGNYKVRVV